jgi:uncharacterized membrane protein YgaE (UPF0421/DUF939 family)
METVETADLLELLFMLEASIDVQFQAWMAITFAVVVASYSARETLSLKLRSIVAFTYLVAAFALLARWGTEVMRIDSLIGPALAARHINPEPSLYALFFRLVTYLLGTLIAVASIFYFSPVRSKAGKTEDNRD